MNNRLNKKKIKKKKYEQKIKTMIKESKPIKYKPNIKDFLFERNIILIENQKIEDLLEDFDINKKNTLKSNIKYSERMINIIEILKRKFEVKYEYQYDFKELIYLYCNIN